MDIIDIYLLSLVPTSWLTVPATTWSTAEAGTRKEGLDILYLAVRSVRYERRSSLSLLPWTPALARRPAMAWASSWCGIMVWNSVRADRKGVLAPSTNTTPSPWVRRVTRYL